MTRDCVVGANLGGHAVGEAAGAEREVRNKEIWPNEKKHTLAKRGGTNASLLLLLLLLPRYFICCRQLT